MFPPCCGHLLRFPAAPPPAEVSEQPPGSPASPSAVLRLGDANRSMVLTTGVRSTCNAPFLAVMI